jgi:hypothetical protein
MYSFEVSQQELFEFEELLNKHGLKIKSNSDLERVSLNITEINEKFKKKILHDDKQDIRMQLSEVAGLTEFIRKILKNQNNADFGQFIPHLHLLNESKSVSQTTKSKITDEGNNKLFELYVALLCMEIGDNLRLDNPKRSKGDNPDILFNLNGITWAIACKALHTRSELTLFDRIEDGVEQINRSAANKGIVIVNFKNIIDYDLIWPITNEEEFKKGEDPLFGSFTQLEIPSAILESYGIEYQKKLVEVKDLANLRNFNASGKCPNGFLIFLQAVTSVQHERNSPVTILKTFNLVRFDEIDAEYKAFVELLNLTMHDRIKKNV